MGLILDLREQIMTRECIQLLIGIRIEIMSFILYTHLYLYNLLFIYF